MDGPPPPPPPHGTNPKTTGGTGGLPAGNYDIFIIPPHSSGGGFLYLPSLQVQRNSFIAGVASTLAGIAVWKMVEPTVKQWFAIVSMSVSSGGNGVLLLVAIVGVAGWASGRTQFISDGFGGSGPGPQGGPAGASSSANPGAGTGYQRAQSPPGGGFPGANAPPPGSTPGGGWHGTHQHQQHSSQPPPPPHDSESSWSGSQPDASAKAEWEKAREETRRREEERKRTEEERKKAAEAQKKKEEAERQARAKAEKEKWERMRAREREQREREARERIAKEKLQREKDARDKEQREREAREAEARARIEKEIREKLETEQRAKAAEEARKKAEEDKVAAELAAAKAKADAEAAAAKAKADADRAERLRAARERAQRDRQAREARLQADAEKLKAAAPATDQSTAGRRATTYGGIGGGERLDPYAGARSPPAPSVSSAQSSPIKATVSPKKNYEKPSAKSYVGTEDAHSFRPYDAPRRPPKPPSHASTYSESSYAPSQSTTRTSPPPSQRGPYSTPDPDKIQIKAVFLFNDLFPKPVAQLVANIGNVTDGLILRITTEGLFIDDDVRHVPQREWDIKAWTLKLVETGERNSQHLLRASIRDADGKKYVFMIEHSESWKLALGLQRLRKGSQVRSLANGQIPPGDMLRMLNAIPPIS